ncbi:hypothetical protein SAMN02745223_03048 [Devosia limi DSM 17137]|uniref:Uncharacterized protein n=1 Tax=Devosia limi DSM 17137 TaxID=1121477 RepID=A0A1M5CT58_9HYPH|nr:hypothetical protein SAMN02745223_03048 [Devosia limi DSM 17137]
MDVRSLKNWLATLAVLAIVLVPIWQAIGHAQTGLSIAIAAEQADPAGVHDQLAPPSAHSTGHHKSADHAHELPIVRLASWVPTPRNRPIWSLLPSPAYGSVGPSRPEQPPRPL